MNHLISTQQSTDLYDFIVNGIRDLLIKETVLPIYTPIYIPLYIVKHNYLLKRKKHTWKTGIPIDKTAFHTEHKVLHWKMELTLVGGSADVYQQMRLTSWLNLLSGISSGSMSIRLGVSVLRYRVWKTYPNDPREVGKMFILPLNLIALQVFLYFICLPRLILKL